MCSSGGDSSSYFNIENFINAFSSPLQKFYIFILISLNFGSNLLIYPFSEIYALTRPASLQSKFYISSDIKPSQIDFFSLIFLLYSSSLSSSSSTFLLLLYYKSVKKDGTVVALSIKR